MKKVLCGNELDRMPDWAFKTMAFIFNVTDRIIPTSHRLDSFNIQKGQTVVDYGCGTGRYLMQASRLAGDTGIVYAADIHDLAIESAFRRIHEHDLKNVRPVLTHDNTVDIPSHSADVVYALDMFHMVKDHLGFLLELNRITKPDGFLILEDGHQKREVSKEKVIHSGLWKILEETKKHMKCSPIPH
jgi:ubiquinone/menaquinone biosynthesis C-methylase UbiE